MGAAVLDYQRTTRNNSEKILIGYQTQIMEQIMLDSNVADQLLYGDIEIIVSDALYGAKDPEATKNCMLYDMNRWKNAYRVDLTNLARPLPYYNTIATTIQLQKEACNMDVNKVIPQTLFFIEIVLGILFSVCTTLMVISIALGTALMNPWMLSMMTLGSAGLFVTSIIAVFDWRKEISEDIQESGRRK